MAKRQLGGRHEISTFQRALGPILAAANGASAIDENALTDWMTRHLMVRTVACPDPDTLGRLEADVLLAIDPPLNLQGMAAAPVRLRVKELRSTYGRT